MGDEVESVSGLGLEAWAYWLRATLSRANDSYIFLLLFSPAAFERKHQSEKTPAWVWARCFLFRSKFQPLDPGPLVNQLPVSGFFGLWCLVVGLFFISKALLCGFCRGPLLEHRAPPVIAGRRGCPSSPTLLSPALPLAGTAAGGVTCCVAEGHRRERNRPLLERGGPDPPMNLRSETQALRLLAGTTTKSKT